MLSDLLNEVPSGLLSPPDAVPGTPPTHTRIQMLPFAALSWENFERLCHRLMARDGMVEHSARYGRQGEAQEGIDIYARLADGTYHCLQAKRHASFGANKLRVAVDLFIEGSWVSRASRFTLAVQAELQSTAVQEAIEEQAARLNKKGIAFTVLDGEGLTERLKEHPLLIDDFFGRPWVEAVLGSDAAALMGERLDGSEFATARQQLSQVYAAQFQFVDPGSFGSVVEDERRSELTLLERFCKPDLLVREAVPSPDMSDMPIATGGVAQGQSGLGASAIPDTTRPREQLDTGRTRRIGAAFWLGAGDRLALIGDAGSGKSTFLRIIALDLLNGQDQFPEIAERWGGLIPLYLPFARWSAEIAREGAQIGFKAIVQRALQPLLTAGLVELLDRAIDEHRVLLLLDGLDEWSDEQAARTTLSTVVTTVEAHAIPAIVSGRPRGLNRIGSLPSSWKRAAIAPLSVAQQAKIAARWFERYAAAEPAGATLSGRALRTERFMAELARDPSLATLAAVPLLLVGLVTLALRGQILPRTRPSIYDQLVRVLLEVHPTNRATAAGDIRPRFRFAQDEDQRRDAIARLAFAIRHDGLSGTLKTAQGRELLRAHLSAPDGYALADRDAAAAANEILAVNAETQGLIVEKAPGEIGFLHASFEEYLCAEYIGGWSFPQIKTFVEAHAGESRWRNVIVNLIAAIQRRDELDSLIAIVEAPQDDELTAFARASLLGEIGVGAAARSPATARRLALETFDRVEREDWMPARRDALSTALRALSDPAWQSEAETYLRRWLPSRATYRNSLIATIAEWPPTASLRSTLWRAMNDEDRGVQRGAAVAFAKAFGGREDARQSIVEGLARTRDLTFAIAMLECLALGWPGAPEARALFEAASRSEFGELRLVGLLGLVENGRREEDAKHFVLASQNFWSDLSYPYRQLAGEMLLKYWPNDDELVAGALRRVSGNFDSHWEHDLAASYLLRTPPFREDVRAWILKEFAEEYPFNGAARNGGWELICPFAVADPEIRAAANAYWQEPKHRLINLHFLHNYVAQIADDEIATLLVELLPNAEGMDRHWIVRAMLAGWKREDPLIKETLDGLVNGGDDELRDLVALIPQIYGDPIAARLRLLQLGGSEEVRRDLLVRGFEACGCDAQDEAAVVAVLAPDRKARGIFDPAPALFQRFSKHPRVHALALRNLNSWDPDLADLARGYADDPTISSALLDAVTPLPTALRSQIVEFATTGAAGTALEDILAHWNCEGDPELRTRMLIAHFSSAGSGTTFAAAHEALLKGARAVGPEFESRRATAFAGLIMTGGLDALAALRHGEQPVALEAGRYAQTIPSLERLICERFADLDAAFGETLEDRFRSFGRTSQLPKILSRAPASSRAARSAFLEFANADAIPRTPGALLALAGEAPGSRLLLDRCFAALDNGEHRNDRATVAADVALILKAEFPHSAEVRDGLVKRAQQLRSLPHFLALAVFDPSNAALPTSIDLGQIDHQFGDWALALHIAGRHATSESFIELVEAMITRPRHTQFDGQGVINIAIEERLSRDPNLVLLFINRIDPATELGISGSLARYLASSGTLDPSGRARTSNLAAKLASEQRLPLAAYDAVADRWRSARVVLLDALAAGLEVS